MKFTRHPPTTHSITVYTTGVSSMTDFQFPQFPLPTLDVDFLNGIVFPDLNINEVMRQWFSSFTEMIMAKEVERLQDLFLPTALWRDLLALTWNIRSFLGHDRITQFLRDQLLIFNPQDFKLRGGFISIQRPYPDLVWMNAMFDFKTNIGSCSGVIRLVPTQSGHWKAYAVLTNLENLHGVQEKSRNSEPNHGNWWQKRQQEAKFEGVDPAVVIIGAGHSGLISAARLRALGVSVLLIEKNARIGDNWRNRYNALCLHAPVWYDHMPYMPFPDTWPMYTPSAKLAGWLEHYADSLEIPVWTSSTVTHASQDSTLRWTIDIQRGDGTLQQLKANHLVFATGFGGSTMGQFDYPGLHDKFKGQYLHSSQHKRASDYVGKKVVVVGSGTSAHDISKDFYDHGIDITMVQRGPTYVMSLAQGWKLLFKDVYWEGAPPVEIIDLFAATSVFPISIGLLQRQVQQIAELDKDLLDGLRKAGFKLSNGELGCGLFVSAANRSGGYYLDAGASQLIADKKIKLKNDSLISEMTETCIKFEDGSELPADLIIFATGLGDARDVVRQICGDEVADRTKPLWRLDAEGEVQGVWRDTGVPNMWYAFTGLGPCRFVSKHLALQIKAIEEGVFGDRYTK